MTLSSTYVRARDGALYKNPVLVFEEGFVCFSDREDPELVIWLSGDDLRPHCDPSELLSRRLGRAAAPNSVVCRSRSQRVVPDTDPWEWRPAIGYFFRVVARIPRPQIHSGTERYPRRCPGRVLDWPQSPFDAAELEIPE